MANRAFRAPALPDHPYGRAVRGALATLPSITRADLDHLRKRAFARATLKIAAAGAIAAATPARLLAEVFCAWPELPELVTGPSTSVANLGPRPVLALAV